MNDPVPSQGGGDGARMPAPQSGTAATADTLQLRLSESLTGSEAAPSPAQLVTADAAVRAPEGIQGPPSVPAPEPVTPPPTPTSTVPAGNPAVPGATPKKSVTDFIPPPMVPKSTLAPLPISGNPWESELERAAASAGVDANMMRHIASKESSGNPNARATTSSAAGLFQITEPTWNELRTRYPQLQLTNRMDPAQQARIAPYYMREIRENLQRVLGREASPAESYLGWFLGPEGSAMALKASPDTPVEAVIGSSAINANPGVFGKVRTIGQLYGWAGQKMGDAAAHPQPAIDLSRYLGNGKDKSHLDGMGWDLKSRLANMINDMPPEIQAGIKINSGYRSPERQAQLWEEALKKYGSPEAARKWVAPPGNSQHNHGSAADLGYESDAVKKWVHANAAKYGLHFPMGHEDWHIEPVGAREGKLLRMGFQRDGAAMPNYKVPYTGFEEVAQRRQQERDAYSVVQAAQAAKQQDWLIDNLTKAHGKSIYDPGFAVDRGMLQEHAKDLPPNYLPYLSKASSQDDFDFRLRQSNEDYERERRLASTPYGTGIRLAVGLFDPANLALSVLSPVGLGARLAGAGRTGMIAAGLADGAIGSGVAELPVMMNRPGYENEDAMWAVATGMGGYIALNRHLWASHPAAPEIEESARSLNKLKQEMQSGISLPQSQVGAARVEAIRDAVRNDLDGMLDLQTDKTAFAGLRFDIAKNKNSKNPLVAKLFDIFAQDTVGNVDKTKATTRPVEADARMMKAKAETHFFREYNDAANDYRERNNISQMEWQTGGEEQFQRMGTDAIRNTDPLVIFDPAVEKTAKAARDVFEYFRELGQNPGKFRGEERRPLPGFDALEPDPNYVPRFVDWEGFTQLHMDYGKGLNRLISEAISAKNPDLDRALAYKIGDAYYRRITQVEAGQELSTQKFMSGADMEHVRRTLIEEGLSSDEVNKALYKLDAEASQSGGKSMTSRQKRRTLLDENFSMSLTDRAGNAREVQVAELYERNLRNIIPAYSQQMSGAVAMGMVRIENPKWKVGHPENERFIVDGLHSDGDWEKLKAQARGLDSEVRYEDRQRTVEGELKQLQFIYESIRGIPSETDRSMLGQAARIVQGVNFIRLMSQAGWSSVAEFANLGAHAGIKHMMTTIPSFRAILKDMVTGKLDDAELRHLERTFAIGTDHLRGSGMTWTASDRATNLNDSSKLSRRLDVAERLVKKGARYTSMVSLAPLTRIQETMALKATLSQFKEAAMKGNLPMNEQRLRLIGLDGDMTSRIMDQIKKHDGHEIVSDKGRKIPILGLEFWDDVQARSAFEYAMNTQVRRMIQQNDLGQMNAMLGSTVGKLLFQFRMFTIGAWSKQTLASLHMRDATAFYGYLGAMMLGSVAYGVQRTLNAQGLPDAEKTKTLEKDLAPDRLVAAAIQRAGASSILPGAYDFFGGMFAGLDPFFDTRASNQPTQSWLANPTTGLIDGIYSGVRQANKSLHGDDEFTSKDFRALSRALNPLHNYPLMLQMMNNTSGSFTPPGN